MVRLQPPAPQGNAPAAAKQAHRNSRKEKNTWTSITYRRAGCSVLAPYVKSSATARNSSDAKRLLGGSSSASALESALSHIGQTNWSNGSSRVKSRTDPTSGTLGRDGRLRNISSRTLRHKKAPVSARASTNGKGV